MVYLDEHLKKYPLMETQDVVKLFMQGILGPAHLVASVDNVLFRISEEYESIKDTEINSPMVEKISDDYARVYLKPYFERFGDFSPLALAFQKSAVTGDKTLLYSALETIKDRFDRGFIDEYVNSGHVLISHSQTYRDAYHPHYLVVVTKLLPSIGINL